MPASLKFDTAAAISKGERPYQEDALITDFMTGSDVSIAVLADGMGGHAAGDLASKVIVTEVFRELTFQREELADSEADAPTILRKAAHSANEVLSRMVEQKPEQRGMGATLLGLLVRDDALNWISVGDSPLFLFRDNQLVQLNEDHSLATQINFLVESGALTEEEGAEHPERNVLTSVLSGDQIAQIDCPAQPFKLRPGDVVIAASDGLQYLPDADIARIIRGLPLARSSEISDALMTGLKALDDPNLDNVTLLAIQVRQAEQPATVSQLAAVPDDPETKGGLWRFGRAPGKVTPRRPTATGPR